MDEVSVAVEQNVAVVTVFDLEKVGYDRVSCKGRRQTDALSMNALLTC